MEYVFVKNSSKYIVNLFSIRLVLIFIFFSNCSSEQQTRNVCSNSDSIVLHNEKDMCIMFYNVENLFDYFDDTLKQDNDFLPQGSYHWTQTKYIEKIQNLYKVIAGLGQWNPPDIIGLCEIENYFVLHDLTQSTPLLKYEYSIVHHDSPDNRGIDVALLYRKDKFRVLSEKAIRIDFTDANARPTRDILYVKGLNQNKDTLHIFINHWPSRWGGMTKSEPKRMFVASVLKSKTDSIFRVSKSPKIIIAGDFNDEPTNNSLIKGLDCKSNLSEIEQSKLYNLSYSQKQTSKTGTHKYHGIWATLDQFIVSSAMLSGNFLMKANVYQPAFLLEDDEKYLGKMPNRTYIGRKYNGGFSDHLPIYLTMNYN